jgi:glycosyltransferase involved in cell wall biosynthesis
MVRAFTESEHWLESQSRHTNNLRSYRLALLLAERGYVVDVVSNRLDRLPSNRVYDAVVGMGKLTRDLAAAHPPTTKKIYITTGLANAVATGNEAARLADVNRRRRCRLRPRIVAKVTTDNLDAFDAFACVGNAFTAATHRRPGVRTFSFNNMPIRTFSPPRRVLREVRHRFMYFASAGQVLKGLDLLLEAFSRRPDLDLVVCGRFAAEKKFVRCFRRELNGRPNIHPVGDEQVVGSEAFLDICGSCAFVILPSAAEGQPGTVVDCMHSGLIPVVTPQCGIDLDDFGFLIERPSSGAVERVLRRICETPVDELERRGAATLEAAREQFSVQAFEQRWREIFDAVGV